MPLFEVKSGWSTQSASLKVSRRPPTQGDCPSHAVPIHSQRQRPHISGGGGLSLLSLLGEIHQVEVGSPFLLWPASSEEVCRDLCPPMTACGLKPLQLEE